MDPTPPPYKSSASISRSRTSRDDIQAMADAMLRTSISSPVTPSTTAAASSKATKKIKPSKTSTASTASSFAFTESSYASTAPPSYRRIRSSVVEARSGRADPPLSPEGSGSAARFADRKDGTIITAAESRRRVQQVQLAVKRANAEITPRDHSGLFKRACSTDLLFLIDTTGSMARYIDAAKEQVRSIVQEIKATFLNDTEVRVAVVGYKDHSSKSRSIQFLDFTPSTDQVCSFLDTLAATGGKDLPEDVLGGIHKAVNASWKLETRLLIHIADAPPHGGILHELREDQDDYYEHGSEPHGLTYMPLLSQLTQLNINYALLRIKDYTDRMAFMFAQIYAAARADVKLLSSNKYLDEMNDLRVSVSSNPRSGSGSKHGAQLQFEEMQLGVSFHMLQHLVVKSATRSASLTATRLTTSRSHERDSAVVGATSTHPTRCLTAIREDEDDTVRARSVPLENGNPLWGTSGWLNETLTVDGFCPDMGVHSASTLNDMMALDDNIRLSVTQLTVNTRPMPFAEGGVRVAYYAGTAASTDRFVLKTFKDNDSGIEHIIEDMRAQALCKAFALEFNSLLRAEHTIDFIVTTGLEIRSSTGSKSGSVSLEPHIDGEYVKYNSNCGFVKEDDSEDPLNDAIQAFSHFTFERSWGSFMVTDLQGVGHVLTDPAIQTKDPERFKLSATNLGIAGFKFFFAMHKCNSVCHRLELKSNKDMFTTEIWEFREEWPTMDSTVCCSNKLCRKIILVRGAQRSPKFPGHRWCNKCWPQLESTTVSRPCEGPGEDHDFGVSLFFWESQGRVAPNKCLDHIERDTTANSAAAAGGGLWSRMQAARSTVSISGRAW